MSAYYYKLDFFKKMCYNYYRKDEKSREIYHFILLISRTK